MTTWAERAGRRLAEARVRKALHALAELEAIDRISPEHGVCYFVGTQEGFVKIGYSRNVNRRVNELHNESLYPVKLLATAPGGSEKEAYYHNRFGAFRSTGEWFHLVPVIEREIARLSASPAQSRAGGVS